MALRPTGLIDSSPSSEKKFHAISHKTLTRRAGLSATAEPAGSISRNASPMNRRPSPNLVGTDGSRLPSRIHSQAKIGASTMTKKGCTTCNQEEGNSKPNRCRSVLRSAKSASDDPAASYPAQNRMANKNSTKMAPIRPHSAAGEP